MIFNSFQFLYFFIIVFLLYWNFFNKTIKLRNIFLLFSNCFFYAWWNWKFLFLLILNIVLVYVLGIKIEKAKNEKLKKIFLTIGLAQGLGTLFYCKYFNFFISSFIDVFGLKDNLPWTPLNIILPLGISFYTFRSIGYLLDVYNEKIEPEKNILIFANFVSFFPTIISGPIDKANKLIPQLKHISTFNYELAVKGTKQILWGLFKKMVIADGCSDYVNIVFNNSASLPSSSLWIGLFYYTIQIYMDFSGYSDIAIGVSKLLGFRVARNFNYPYFSQNIADYWKRWHISLTSWLTEYIFTPISIELRDWGNKAVILGIILTFLSSGLWHGANWTFVLWGLLNGLYFIPLIIAGKMNKKKKFNSNNFFPTPKEFFSMLSTFLLVMITNVFFRADSVKLAFVYLKGLFSYSIFKYPTTGFDFLMLFLILITMIFEWSQKDKEFALESLNIKYKPIRWGIYMILFFSLFQFFDQPEREFIYFKF
ncbi:MAG: MBOAT family O-acyltransferase [Bacteroidales bacterium]|nr:MBOAT family O-acyltransferase [Bacteroidales bacterium]